jgi:hypothetical protein
MQMSADNDGRDDDGRIGTVKDRTMPVMTKETSFRASSCDDGTLVNMAMDVPVETESWPLQL